MLKTIMTFHSKALESLEAGAQYTYIASLRVKEKIAKMKYISKDNLQEFDSIEKEIKENLKSEAQDEA